MVKEKKIPQRKCVVCGSMKEKTLLLRIVRTPEGEIVVDKTGKTSGRGAYICKDEKCIEKACKYHKLDRALDKSIGDDVYKKILEAKNQ